MFHNMHGTMRHLGGWKRQAADSRDHAFKLEPMVSHSLPLEMLDMRRPWQAVIGIANQGELGSCTAQGTLECFRWPFWKARREVPEFSTLAQYYYSRVKIAHGAAGDDSGCTIRDAVKTVHQIGACDAKLWPYDPTLFDLNPPEECLISASKHKSMSYHLLHTVDDIKTQLANWYPVVGGFTCYESLQSEAVGKTGAIPIPTPGETVIGGHCMAFVGYCNDRKAFLCANSWGSNWGDGGFAWLPYWYVESNNASDFWVIHTETNLTLLG